MRITGRVGALLRAAGAAAALAALLFGAPALLLRLVDLRPLIGADWVAALTGGTDASLLLALLGAIGWLAWLFVAAGIVAELITVVSHYRIRVRLPGTGWLRPLISALLVGATTPTMFAAADTPAPVPVDVSTASGVSTVEVATAETGRVHVVTDGEELWDIAEQELGSGERWREIAVLNPGLADSSRLIAGTRLQLPEDAVPVRDGAVTERVVVQAGDTLWDIADRTLGDPERWPEIHDLNKQRIEDPDQIDVGWVLKLPQGVGQGAAESPADEENVEALVEDKVEESPGEGEVEHALAAAPEGSVELVEAHGFVAPDPLAGPTSSARLEATPGGTAMPSPVTARPVDKASAAEPADDPSDQLAALGATLAAVVLGGVATRRRAQLLGRAVGRRLIPVPSRVARYWTALAHRAEDADVPARGITATTVVLGDDDLGEQVLLDLASTGACRFTGEAASELQAAVLTSLSCAPWSEEVEVVVVGETEWATAVDDPRITSIAAGPDALTRLTRLCSKRRIELRDRTLAEVRRDAEAAQAWTPVVFLFEQPLTGTQPHAIADALALGEVGVHVVVTGDRPIPGIDEVIVDVQPARATWAGHEFCPHLLSVPARRALVDLFGATGTSDTLPAPWLGPNHANDDHQASQEPTMSAEPTEHPMVLLLGDVDLVAAAGTEPSRARTSCIEYCAWLLANPRARSTAMSIELMVAESTRRSNMSRLRAWLGCDVDGADYLPDAYSGRIDLDPRVTSDWEQFQGLLSAGVAGSSPSTLRAALRLVRGVPLGTASFQWLWAQTMQADMVAMIVDTAATLADRAIETGDYSLALWAARRGQLAAPNDDELAAREIQVLSLVGRLDEAQRQALALTRRTRAESRDLPTDLALRVQLALTPQSADASLVHS